MPLVLRPRLHAAFPGRHAILLDEATDRYTRLGLAPSQLLRSALDGADIATERLQPLLDAGLLSPAAARPSSSSPSAICRDLDDGTAQLPISRLRVAYALLEARGRLRRGLDVALDQTRLLAQMPKSHDEDRALAFAVAVDRIRPSLPFFRLCLPDAVAFCRLLADQGLAATLVIGVRDCPFVAHAWVQSGATLLSDRRDDVAEFTPILSI